MKWWPVFLFIFLFSSSCREKDADSAIYYRKLANINNEVIYQLHLALYNTRSAIEAAGIESDSENINRFDILKNEFDTISSLCLEKRAELDEIGPFHGDPILYDTFRELLDLVDELYSGEFKSFISSAGKGELTAERLDAIYNASEKLAGYHIRRIDSIFKFNRKYSVNLDTLELSLSKNNTEKFTRNLSIMYRSIPITGDILNGYGQIRDVQGTLYTGQFKNGLFHGKGKLEYADGETYVGEFRNGNFQGYGTYSWNDGSVYAGEWRDDQFNGVGSMIQQSGDTLFGYWFNGILTEL